MVILSLAAAANRKRSQTGTDESVGFLGRSEPLRSATVLDRVPVSTGLASD